MLEIIWNQVIHVPVEVAKMMVIPVCMWSSLSIWVFGLLKDHIPILRRVFHLFVGYFPEVFAEVIPIACAMLVFSWYMICLPYFSLVMAGAFVYLRVILRSVRAANSSSYYTKAFSVIFVVLILSTSPHYVVFLYVSGLFIYMIRKDTVIATDETPLKLPKDHMCRTDHSPSGEKTDNPSEDNLSFTIAPQFKSVDRAIAVGIIKDGIGNKVDIKHNNISESFDPHCFADTFMPRGRERRRRGEKDDNPKSDSKNTADIKGQVTAQRIEGNVLTTTEVTGNTITTNVKDSTIAVSLLKDLIPNDYGDGKGSRDININLENVGEVKNEEEKNEMRKLFGTANLTQKIVSESKSDVGRMIKDTKELSSKIGTMMADNKRCISNIQEMCHRMEIMVESKFESMKEMVGLIRTEQTGVKEEVQSKIGTMLADNKRCISNTQEICHGMEVMAENKLADMKDMVGQIRSEQNGIKDELQSKIGTMLADNKRCISSTQEMCHGMEVMVENKLADMKEMVGQIRSEQNGLKDDVHTLSFGMQNVKEELDGLTSTRLTGVQQELDTVMEKLSRFDDISDKVLKLPHQHTEMERIIENVAEKVESIEALCFDLRRRGCWYRCCQNCADCSHHSGHCPNH